MTSSLEAYREYEKKEHARVRDLMNEVLLAWLKLQWKLAQEYRHAYEGPYLSPADQWKIAREYHVECWYQQEIEGDSTNMPASVQRWEDDLPVDEGCPTCGYGGEEHVIIHFTTVTGETGVMRHEISDFGEFISDLCYARED